MTLTLQVVDAADLNPLIRQVRLARTDGQALPAFEAGAHIQVQVKLAQGGLEWRHYSLVELDPSADLRAPREYTLAVRREDEGRGGSRFMHGLKAGDVLAAQEPKNEFALRTGSGTAVLVAGGIGITPLASMAARCRAIGQRVRMHYAGRSRALMAFIPELQALLGDDLRLHQDDVAAAPLDVDHLLDACKPADEIHVCGPKPLLDAVLARANARGWPQAQLHFEVFTSPAEEAGDRAFEVVLAQTGRTVQVGAHQTVLDCLIEAGCDPMFDCRRGECGVCSVPVVEGDVDHRDYFLSDAEKASGTVMQACVSRARGARLVLDL